MRRTFRTSLVAVIGVLLCACAGTRVATDHDPGADFGSLRAFAWLEPQRDEVDDPVLDSTLLGRKLQRSTVAYLTERGFVHAGDTGADFLVTYHTGSRERLRSEGGFSLGIGIGRGHYYRGPHAMWYGDGFFPSVESYQEGTLIIDVLDADRRELVWRGWVRSPVRPERFTEQAIDEAVREILARFPPGYTPPE